MGGNSENESDHENSVKKDRNDVDVSCWNCFGSEDSDRDIEPVPLPKIREKQREKLKMYSFLASEISKPKTVSLKQKIGSHYQVSKKIDEKIGKKIDPVKYREEVENNFGDTSNTESSASTPSKSEIKYDDNGKPVRRKIKSLIKIESYDELKRSDTFNVKPILQKQHATEEYSAANKVGLALAKNRINQSRIQKQLSQTLPAKKISEYSNIKADFTTFSKQMSLDSPKRTANITTKPSSESIKSTKGTYHMSFDDNFNKSTLSLSKIGHYDSNTPLTLKQIHADDSNESKTSDSNEKKPENFDNVLYKGQIETSTPKGSKHFISIDQEVDTDIKSTKSESSFNADNEDSILREKADNISSNGSESGYAGSLATVQDTAENENNNLSEKISSLTEEMKKLSIEREPFKSSLPALNKIEKKILKHPSISMASDMNSAHKKSSPKSITWSTMTLPSRSFSVEDEVYISDTLSPGHATLPRRSSSPLPHDADRDRFSLNRSGLQARSESMASVYSGAGEGMRGTVTVKGEVQFSLLYNYRLGALEVGVKRCRDLAPIDVKRNRSDPYVKVYLLPDKSKTGKRKTKVKKNTLNPVFEETLSFVQPLASLSSRTLWLSVWHADMFGRNDFLGEVALPLAGLVFDDAAPVWYRLHERTEPFDEQQGTRGDIIIGLKFEPEPNSPRNKGTLHVLVKEAKNLVATKPNGLADVFCKSYLLPERGRLAKQKTGVARRTLNPRWEHTFTYRGVTLGELASRALELSLWDRDRLASNDFMGAVRLSLGTGVFMGANVNWMDSVGKEVTLWQTMMQRPNFWVEGSLPLRPQLNHNN